MNFLFLWWSFILTIILVSPVRIWIDYRHRGTTEDSLLVQASILWGARMFSIEIPVISSSGKGVSLKAESGKKSRRFKLPRPTLDQLKQGKVMFRQTRKPMKLFYKVTKRLVNVHRLVWHTELGIRDNAGLAQLTGVLWAFKGTMAAAAQKILPFKNHPIFRIRPKFNSSYFRTVFTCILEFPLGYIIIAAIFGIYLVIKVKLAKRGEANVRASNPRSDENSHGKHQGNGGRQHSNR